MFGKIKIDTADRLWSEYLRKLRGRCEYCGATENLTCSHYHGRKSEGTRYCEINCDVLCISCHMKLEHEKGWTEGTLNGTKIRLPKKYTDWKLKQLGQARYDALLVQSKTYCKKDRKLQVIRIRELLKTLK